MWLCKISRFNLAKSKLIAILGDYTCFNTGFNFGLGRGLQPHIHLISPTFSFLLLQNISPDCIIWFICYNVVITRFPTFFEPFYLITMRESCISGHLSRPLHAGFKGKPDCCLYDRSQNIHSVSLQFYSFQAQLQVHLKQIIVHGKKVVFGLIVQNLFAVWKFELEGYLLQMFTLLFTSVWCDIRHLVY